MPIVDVEIVGGPNDVRSDAARRLADGLGAVFATPVGRTWVRLRFLESADYAENAVECDATSLPVFVTVLHAHPPIGAALHAEVAAVTTAVAKCTARAPDRVHVQYAAAGAGRQAFGGRLVE